MGLTRSFVLVVLTCAIVLQRSGIVDSRATTSFAANTTQTLGNKDKLSLTNVDLKNGKEDVRPKREAAPDDNPAESGHRNVKRQYVEFWSDVTVNITVGNQTEFHRYNGNHHRQTIIRPNLGNGTIVQVTSINNSAQRIIRTGGGNCTK